MSFDLANTRNRLRQARSTGGFTLIEVLVSLLITILALSVLYGGVANAFRTARETASLDRAVSRAQSRLAEIDNPASMVGVHESNDSDGYRWSIRVTLTATAPAPPTVRSGPWAHGTGLYALVITIQWREAAVERRLVLNSAQLGPLTVVGP